MHKRQDSTIEGNLLPYDNRATARDSGKTCFEASSSKGEQEMTLLLKSTY